MKITSPDQKRAYKADFNADYSEYKGLYPIVEKVSKRFIQLEAELKQQGENSPRFKVSLIPPLLIIIDRNVT